MLAPVEDSSLPLNLKANETCIKYLHLWTLKKKSISISFQFLYEMLYFTILDALFFSLYQIFHLIEQKIPSFQNHSLRYM